MQTCSQAVPIIFTFNSCSTYEQNNLSPRKVIHATFIGIFTYIFIIISASLPPLTKKGPGLIIKSELT